MKIQPSVNISLEIAGSIDMCGKQWFGLYIGLGKAIEQTIVRKAGEEQKRLSPASLKQTVSFRANFLCTCFERSRVGFF